MGEVHLLLARLAIWCVVLDIEVYLASYADLYKVLTIDCISDNFNK